MRHWYESLLWLSVWNNSWVWTFPIGQFRFFRLWNDLWLSNIDFHLSSFSNLTSGFTSGGANIIWIIRIIRSVLKYRVVTTVNLMPFITRASPVSKILIWFSYKFRVHGPLTLPGLWPGQWNPDFENQPYCHNIQKLTVYNQQVQKAPIVDLDYNLRLTPGIWIWRICVGCEPLPKQLLNQRIKL